MEKDILCIVENEKNLRCSVCCFRIAVTMAVARPIRMLGAASIILCLFLIFQLNKGPTTLLGSQGKLSSMKADPLLQRAFGPPLL